MDALTRIRKPVERELADFESLFAIHLRHPNPILEVALRHVFSRKGKMMRPVLTLLSAKKCGEVTPAVLHAAASMEMLHTASLVHDDVVDESSQRRGQRSVNALLDNKAAVLVGDFLLSSALEHASLTGSLQVVESVAQLGKMLSDGELLQLSNLQSEVIAEEQYFDVIFHKTASLFAVCAEVGALLAGASADEVARARRFGEYVGLCFQIRDDIFDYYDNEVGKPTGNDMKEGKLTLPVVYAVTQDGARQWFDVALKVRRGAASDAEIAALVDFTKSAGGIDYAVRKMEEIRLQALEAIGESDHTSVAESLRHYLDFVLQRRS